MAGSTVADPARYSFIAAKRGKSPQQLGDCSRFEGPIIPIIYAVNLRDPSGYPRANVQMRNKDVIYTISQP